MLARDPVGIKPLYYGYVGDKPYFASELGAMSLSGVELAHEFPLDHYYTLEGLCSIGIWQGLDFARWQLCLQKMSFYNV